MFGKGITTAVPGSAQGTFLIVNDIAAARAELVGHGADVSEVFHFDGGLHVVGTQGRVPGPDPEVTPTNSRGGRQRWRGPHGSCPPLRADIVPAFRPIWLGPIWIRRVND